MTLLRALSRLFELLLMVVLAAAGLALVAYSIDAVIGLGANRPDRLLHLPAVRRHVGHALRQWGDPGPAAVIAVICGGAAALLGALLLIGLLAPRRPRLLTIADENGVVAARPRVVGAMLRNRAAAVPEVARVSRPRVRVGRVFSRARLTVVPSAAGEGDGRAVRQSVQDALEAIAEPLGVRVRTDVNLTRKRS